MAKTTIKNLVSLILEQINTKAELDITFPPDQYVYVQNIFDYPELFEPVEDVEQPDDKVRTLQPEPQPDMEPELEPNLEMVAEMAKDWTFDKTVLEVAMRIPANVMILSPKSQAKLGAIPKIICIDPDTNEFVEDMAIGTLIMTTPSGHEVLVFYNYGLEQKLDRTKKQANFCVLKDTWKDEVGDDMEVENVYMKANVRGGKYGRGIERDPQAKLRAEIEAETDPQKKEELEGRLRAIQDANAKRYGLFVSINQMFDTPEVLNHLDSALIPETWGTAKRTEGTWNTIKMNKVGGDTPEINIDFVSVRDLKSVDDAINDVMELRVQLATDEDATERERETSQQMVRSHGGTAYPGGKWSPGQRVADVEAFRRAGGKTRVYELLSKNIQEGDVNVTISSKLELVGHLQDDGEYVMTATFSSKMYDRGERGMGRLIGDLFEPIRVGLRKQLPEGVDAEEFTLEKNTGFFVDGGRQSDMGETRTGYLPELLKTLSDEIINQVDPDEVLATMIQLVQDAVDNEPEDINI